MCWSELWLEVWVGHRRCSDFNLEFQIEFQDVQISSLAVAVLLNASECPHIKIHHVRPSTLGTEWDRGVIASAEFAAGVP